MARIRSISLGVEKLSGHMIGVRSDLLSCTGRGLDIGRSGILKALCTLDFGVL